MCNLCCNLNLCVQKDTEHQRNITSAVETCKEILNFEMFHYIHLKKRILKYMNDNHQECLFEYL